MIDWDIYMARSHVLKREGWTPKVLERFLGEPDQMARNPRNANAPIRLYLRARVEAAEASPTWRSPPPRSAPPPSTLPLLRLNGALGGPGLVHRDEVIEEMFGETPISSAHQATIDRAHALAAEVRRLEAENKALEENLLRAQKSAHWLTTEVDRLKAEVNALKAKVPSKPAPVLRLVK